MPSASLPTMAALYEGYYPLVLAYAHRRTGRLMDAEDVAAQTFLHAARALDRYEERGVPMEAWLLRIASSILADHARARKRRQDLGLDETYASLDDVRGSPHDGPDAWAERWDRALWLRGHLAALSAEQRQALWLRFGEDRPIDDVAAHLGRSPNATKQILYRTVKLLRARMLQDDAASSLR